jgi:hypothetical protein
MSEKVTVQPVDFIRMGDFVKIGPNYLQLTDDVPAEALPVIYGQLKSLGGALQWFIGDFFTQVDQLRGNEYAQQMMNDWEISYARASTCKRVALAFDKSLRRQELSFSHHEEALQITESVETALDLLELASENGWSVARMRQSTIEEPAKKAEPTQSVNFQPVYDCLRLCKATDPKSLDVNTREQLKLELEPLVKWHSQL